MKKELFINKHCRVSYLTNFVLEGVIRDIDDNGIIFETKQKTSFIAWQSIRDIQLIEGEY